MYVTETFLWILDPGIGIALIPDMEMTVLTEYVRYFVGGLRFISWTLDLETRFLHSSIPILLAPSLLLLLLLLPLLEFIDVILGIEIVKRTLCIQGYLHKGLPCLRVGNN